MRLIDADAIEYIMLYKEDFLKGTGCEKQAVWKSDIDSMPTVDAVDIATDEWRQSGELVCPMCGHYEEECEDD